MTTEQQPSLGPLDPAPRRVPHNLALFTPLKQGARFVEMLAPRFSFYQRSFRFHGGCWQMVLEASEGDEGAQPYDPEYAHEWAQNRIGFHFEERLGRGAIWSGMIDEVELVAGGWGERLSLLPVANKVRAVYVDGDGATRRTAWVDDAPSQNRYGIRQKEVVLEREESTATEAATYAQDRLVEMANPRVEPLAVSAGQSDRLVVRGSGYVFTANTRYVSVGAGAYTVSDFVRAVTAADLEFITAGRIQANSEQTLVGSAEVTPVWEGFRGVVELRADHTTLPHVVRVMGDRRLNYFQPGSAPAYRWRDRAVYTIAGAGTPVEPWEVYPAIIRNPYARRTSAPPGSYLTDGRDRIMWEVTMSTRQAQPIITWAGSTEVELKKAYEIRSGQEIHSL